MITVDYDVNYDEISVYFKVQGWQNWHKYLRKCNGNQSYLCKIVFPK